MTSKIKNIIIFAAVGIALVLIYIFFIKKAPEQATLVSTSSSVVVSTSDTSGQNSSVNQNFLSLLLNVKNIRLDTAIFSDGAFVNLRDSSIVLVPDGTEGRDNPFAPIGLGNPTLPSSNINATTNALPPSIINNVNNPPIIMPN